MLSAHIEQEIRDDFARVGDQIETPHGLTERLLARNHRNGRRSRLVALGACVVALVALVVSLVVVNTGDNQPVAASVLKSEFHVFNRPATPSDAVSRTSFAIQLPLTRAEQHVTTRLLASNPGYGITRVYAAMFPTQLCILVRAQHGQMSGGCELTSGVESAHMEAETETGSPTSPGFAVGLVANDVTSVQVNGVTAPVLRDNFFLAPLPSPNPPFTITAHLSDGPPQTWTVPVMPAPRTGP
jgi:hypothetical protein